MAVNKVEINGDVKIDLTSDTVTADSLEEGLTAHGSDGEPIVGIAKGTWTGTKEQYKAAENDIPIGTIVHITDDYISGRSVTDWEYIGTFDLSDTTIIPGLNNYDEFYIVAEDLDILYTYVLKEKSTRLAMGFYNNTSVSVLYLGTIDWNTCTITRDVYVTRVWQTNNKFKFYGKRNGYPTKYVYSLEEKIIGSFLDKPLYSRVFDLGSDVNISNTKFTDTSVSAANISRILNCKGSYSTGVTFYNLTANIANGIIRIQTDRNDAVAYVRYLILEYTKTTD